MPPAPRHARAGGSRFVICRPFGTPAGSGGLHPRAFVRGVACAALARGAMTLRIDTTRGGRVYRLVGRIQRENLGELEREIAGNPAAVLDLEDVTLVDREGVRFLSDAEGAGAELRHCPPFIREWIEREREVGR